MAERLITVPEQAPLRLALAYPSLRVRAIARLLGISLQGARKLLAATSR